ncbi:MAG: DUF1801 domain-containing protein [Thermoplasmata archaeon]|nr:MAG: DUF1801 domain-containing protein [Thermoplasmata archaeon]
MKQDELVEIFDELKGMMKVYEDKGKLEPKFDLDSKYDLWSFKDVEIAGRKRKEVSFATIIIQSSYVGLYYMPIYTDTDLAYVFEPELLATLKGKSCFHIKRMDDTMRAQIDKALRVGYDLYEERGWV